MHVMKLPKKGIADKAVRSESFAAVKESFLESLSEEETEELNDFLVKKYFSAVQKKAVRNCVLDTKKTS